MSNESFIECQGIRHCTCYFTVVQHRLCSGESRLDPSLSLILCLFQVAFDIGDPDQATTDRSASIIIGPSHGMAVSSRIERVLKSAS